MAYDKYTKPKGRRPAGQTRRGKGLSWETIHTYLALRKRYPLGEMDASCTKGMNGGRCTACLVRGLQIWGVDINAFFREALARRKQAHVDWLKNTYGMADPVFETMLIEQQGVCALCGAPETRQVNGIRLPLAVDHSHATGEVRALLCASCNTALGYSETRGLPWVRRAVAYLKQHMSVSEQAKFRGEEKPTRNR